MSIGDQYGSDLLGATDRDDLGGSQDSMSRLFLGLDHYYKLGLKMSLSGEAFANFVKSMQGYQIPIVRTMIC